MGFKGLCAHIYGKDSNLSLIKLQLYKIYEIIEHLSFLSSIFNITFSLLVLFCHKKLDFPFHGYLIFITFTFSLCIHLLMKTYLGCFCILAFTNDIEMNMESR